MVPFEHLERRAADLLVGVALTTPDMQAILAQTERVLAAIDQLDQLPLDGVEPDFLNRSQP
ncbi:MAG: hypothetical protein K2R98_20955 [Gemmataceae bacterium]|nr:hypothetical protein [Gemmataceae bacterium]